MTFLVHTLLTPVCKYIQIHFLNNEKAVYLFSLKTLKKVTFFYLELWCFVSVLWEGGGCPKKPGFLLFCSLPMTVSKKMNSHNMAPLSREPCRLGQSFDVDFLSGNLYLAQTCPVCLNYCIL